MKKGKNIFIVIFSLLLLTMSAVIISLYDNVKENTTIQRGNMIEYYFKNDFQFLTLSLAKELNPDFEIINFDENILEIDKKDISDEISNDMAAARYALLNDQDFIYQIKDTKTGKTLSKNYDKVNPVDDKRNYKFYAKINYDENGTCQLEGNLADKTFGEMNIKNLFDIERNYEFTNYEDEISYQSDQSILDHVSINQPKNLEIEYILPEVVTSYDVLSGFINSWENYNTFSAIALVVASIILAFFIICYPIKYVENVKPFNIIKNWKAEINIPILTAVISLGCMACMILSGNTLNGYLTKVLANYKISYIDIILLATNLVTWILTFLMISLGLFLIKYICVHGIWRYLKEDTLIGTFFKYCKKQLDLISEIDLSLSINKTIMKYVLLNGIIVILMITFWGFGYVIAIVYSFFVFFFVKNKVSKIQDDYNCLLNSTKELGKGNFDEEIKSDLGIFNSLKVEFNKIKEGFKKAVQEETKSQNLKTELISNVSHDLKTPLTCIKNYIILLQDDDLTLEDRHEYLDNLNQYSNRLTTLIEDLFEVSKANSGNIQINPVNLNIVALLEQTYAENEEALQIKDLTVLKNFVSEDIILYLDGDKTYRIFENLFTNISKYAMPHSRVYLDLKDEDNKVVIEFKNVSEVQMNFSGDEISERFVRGDKSRHETGSGLGLAIAKSFTEIQGGEFKITVDCDLFKVRIEFNKSNQV